MMLGLLLALQMWGAQASTVFDPGNPPGWDAQKLGPHANTFLLRSAFALRLIEKWLDLLKLEYPKTAPYVAVEKRTFGFREDGTNWYASWKELEPVLADVLATSKKYENLRLARAKEWRTPAILGEPHQLLGEEEMYRWLKKYVYQKECRLLQLALGDHPELPDRCRKFFYDQESGGRFHYNLALDGSATVESETIAIQEHWNAFLYHTKQPYPQGTPGSVSFRRGPYGIDEKIDVQKTHELKK